MDMTQIRIDRLRMDARTQARATTNQDVVEDYTEALLAGCMFPPIVVFIDPAKNYWPADGWHRIKAHVGAGRKTIDCDVRQGDERDAILHAVGANTNHGFRRSNEDKRRAVGMLLADVEWARWSGEKIADQCGVSPGLVSMIRRELTLHNTVMPRQPVLVERGGKTYEMKVDAIGTREVIGQVQAKRCALCGGVLAG